MPEPLDADNLTWAVLLGRWVDFARAAVALPDDAAGNRLRDSVPDIIQLQAVWFALQHMDGLAADQHALGLDRAAVLIDKHATKLRDRFAGEAIPEMIAELIGDARAQLDAVAGTVSPPDESSDSSAEARK